MGTIGKVQRMKKGEISLSQTRGTIRLRWRYNGDRYTLNPHLPYNALGIERAGIIIQEIKLDIEKGTFDVTLNRYRPKAIAGAVIQKHQDNPVLKKADEPCLLEKYHQWVMENRHGDLSGNNDYEYRVKERN